MLVGLWLVGLGVYGTLGLIFQISCASGPPEDLLGGLFGASLEASWRPPGASGRALGAEFEF